MDRALIGQIFDAHVVTVFRNPNNLYPSSQGFTGRIVLVGKVFDNNGNPYYRFRPISRSQRNIYIFKDHFTSQITDGSLEPRGHLIYDTSFPRRY